MLLQQLCGHEATDERRPRGCKLHPKWQRDADLQRLQRCRGAVAVAGRAAQAPSLATRWVRRETLRLAVCLCTTPFWAARMMIGSACFSAARAAARLPRLIASPTLRTQVRSSDRRPLLISVRRAILRAAFLADLVFAILVPLRHGRFPSDAHSRS